MPSEDSAGSSAKSSASYHTPDPFNPPKQSLRKNMKKPPPGDPKGCSLDAGWSTTPYHPLALGVSWRTNARVCRLCGVPRVLRFQRTLPTQRNDALPRIAVATVGAL